MVNTLIYKDVFQCDLKDVDKKSRRMMGAFTRYNVLDSDGDIGRKGMFTKTWSENFARIKHLLNHDATKPVGKIKRLWDDDEFAYYESIVGTHKLGDDVLDMAESGLLTEHSYGYNVVREQKSKEGNELLQVKQWELSTLTGWGANEYTPLLSFSKSVEGKDIGQKMEARMKTLERFCFSSNASDDTIELLLLEIKQLQTSILNISTNSTAAADKAPQPQTGEKDEDLLLLDLSLETTLFKFKSF
jgi:HK97 family phage prohead protease